MASGTVPQGAGIFSGGAEIAVLQQGVNAVLSTMDLTNNEAIYKKLCFVDNGITTNGTPVGRSIAGIDNGGDGQAGELIDYPLAPVSNAPQAWPFGVPAQEVDAVIVNVQVERKREYVPIVKLYLDKQDPYQILASQQGQIAARMMRAPDLSVRDLINSNSVPSNYFDGLSYFHTAHPIAPGSSVTFSNDITCTQAQWDSGDGMAALLDALASIPWFDGVLKDGAMSKPLIVTPRQTLAFKARQLVGLITSLVGAPLIPQSGGATGHSPFTGMVSDVVNFQDLYQPATYADSGKYVYAFATAGGAVQPAIIMSPKRWPYMNIYGLDPSEEIRRVQGAIGWNWSGYWGAGWGLPQCGVRMKILP